MAPAYAQYPISNPQTFIATAHVPQYSSWNPFITAMNTKAKFQNLPNKNSFMAMALQQQEEEASRVKEQLMRERALR